MNTTNEKNKNIAVVGVGYVGLTLGLTLADVGYNVYGIESNAEVVAQLNDGKPHIFEEGIVEKLNQYLGKNFFVSVNMPDVAIDVFIIAVGTPLAGDSKEEVDFSHIISASQTIGNYIRPNNLVILRSTVPVGTSRDIVAKEIERYSGLIAGKDYSLVFASERTLAGKALQETRNLPQIIGGINKESVDHATAFFKIITKDIVSVSSLEAAEMTKLLDNSYRDLRFAYANEIAIVSEKLGLNAKEIIDAANFEYPRNSIPVPSPGVGGYCLSKDPYIFLGVAKRNGHKIKIIKRARTVNEAIPIRVAERVIAVLREQGKNLKTSKIFLAGFAFKGNPQTDDMRHSTTLSVLEQLRKYIPSIYGYDPVISEERLNNIGIIPIDFYGGIIDADAVLVLNNHTFFRDVDVAKIIATMKKPSIYFDAWQMLKPNSFTAHPEVCYMSVGY